MVLLTYVKGFLLQDGLIALLLMMLSVLLLSESVNTYVKFMQVNSFYNKEVSELYETKRLYIERDAHSDDDVNDYFDVDDTNDDNHKEDVSTPKNE